MSISIEGAQEAAWHEMAAIMGVDPSNTDVLELVRSARFNWMEYLDRPENITPSLKMKNELRDVGRLAFELSEKLGVVRSYVPLAVLIHANGFSDEGGGVSPFGDKHIEILRKITVLASHTSDELKVSKGQKGDVARRYAFVDAANIYEQHTGRKASYSRDAEQNVVGPFVEYLLAFCRFCFPYNRHDAGTVAAFCDWMRETRGSARDPLLRLLGLEVVTG